MIPILYESTETSFTSNGIGALPDCLSCLVTEERNGQYEVEFTYPITGAKYAEILEGRIICVTHDEQLDKQPFIIYRRSAPMDGIVTFNAHHYSYLLSGIAVSPFTASSVADAFQKIGANSMITNPFTFWTDNTTAGSMDIDIPISARQVLGGVRGSILDVFGGEYEFDGLTVKNYAHRGANNGVTIRYGKNLTDLQQTIDAEFLPNAAVPYWKGSDDTVVYGAVTAATGQTATRVTVMDLSQDFEDQPSAAQLQTAARAKLDAGQPWLPSQNISVDFVALWQTEEFKDIAPLERVQLCDTVTIEYPELGVSATAKVIKVVWDALLDRYDSMELGEPQSSFADTILSETDARFTEIDETIRTLPTTSMMETAIDHATELITGGLGGYVIINTDAGGHPTEILIMDTPSTATAVNVWRFNSGGLGHSHSGYNGPYNDIALTQDGQINANMITTGTLLATMIYGGILTLGGSGNGNGVLVVKNASGTEIGRWDNTGITINKGTIQGPNITLGGNGNANGSLAVYNSAGTLIGQWDAAGFLMKYLTSSSGNVILSVGDAKICTGYSQVQAEAIFRTLKGLLIRYNESSEWNSFAVVPDSNLVGITTMGTTKIIDTKMVGGSYDLPNASNAMIVNTYYEVDNIHCEVYEKVNGSFASFGFKWSPGSYAGINGTYVNRQDGHLFLDAGTAYLRVNNTNSTNIIDIHSTNNRYLKIQSGVEIHAGTSIYLDYSSNYWKIKGTNQDGNLAVQGSSSRRYKHDITEEISEELNPHKLYKLPMKQFVFNSDHSVQYPDMRDKTLPGFIAEDVEEIYPSAVIHNEDGSVENWDERRIIPGMLKLIQEQHEEIESLKDRVDRLEKLIERMEAKL